MSQEHNDIGIYVPEMSPAAQWQMLNRKSILYHFVQKVNPMRALICIYRIVLNCCPTRRLFFFGLQKFMAIP